jgi:valyl-tRNA synthetase
MLQSFPRIQSELINERAEVALAGVREMVEALRNFKGENHISPKVEFALGYLAGSEEAEQLIQAHAAQIQFLSRVGALTRLNPGVPVATGESMIQVSRPPIEFRIQLRGLVNADEEMKRVEKELEKLKVDVEFVEKKLSQETFLSRAPAHLVEKEKARQLELLSKKSELEKVLEKLRSLR